VRAYATNDVGTAYGHEESFTTDDLFTNCGSIVDVEGNIYKTVIIGTQCWMRENLRTTQYADGTSITYGESFPPSATTAYYYYPGSPDNVPTYGLLYNWSAAMKNEGSSDTDPSGVQGVCPEGWHLPSLPEWEKLRDYVSSQPEYRCDGNSQYIAKSLASTSGWLENADLCAVGNNLSANNATGLSILPAGYFYDEHSGFGVDATFWSTTEDYHYDAYCLLLVSSDELMQSAHFITPVYRWETGYSVRCVRNNP
jgi:uncharacterized protein (TIGR02145 family)